MVIGYFTTDERGRLTDESVLTVDDVETPIPPRTERGGVFAAHRLVEAIHAAGYRPAPSPNPREWAAMRRVATGYSIELEAL